MSLRTRGLGPLSYIAPLQGTEAITWFCFHVVGSLADGNSGASKLAGVGIPVSVLLVCPWTVLDILLPALAAALVPASDGISGIVAPTG
jgi:hypothetical protein